MVALMTIFRKEIEDHFNSWRFITIFLLMFVPSIYFIWHGALGVKDMVTSVNYFFFLPMYTASILDNPIPLLPNSFLELVAVVLPLMGIALGLDAINSEKNNGTLSRLVSQPVYRDSVINAKFLAGVVTITVVMTSIVLISIGMGIRIIGIVPTIEEIWRLFFFLVISIIYGSFWLGLAILFSTLFKRVVASAMLSLAIWLFFAIFFPLFQQLIANSLSVETEQAFFSSMQTLINISRISPIQLFNESMAIVLLPQARTMSQILLLSQSDAADYLLNTPLSVGQSLLIVWPQIIITILLTTICFAIAYIKFMREEIRST